MILTIDTTGKTIEIKGNVKFSELYGTLDSLFPNGWKDYTLVSIDKTSIFSGTGTSIIPNKPYNPYTQTSQIYGTATLSQ